MVKGWKNNKLRHSLSSKGIKNANGIEYSHHWAGRDYYEWTCDNCGRSMLIQEGEDVACCPCEFEEEFKSEGIKRYRAYNIDWDTDDEDVDLPKEIIFELDEDQDPSIDGANVISDKVGWCINSFSFEKINDKSKGHKKQHQENSVFIKHQVKIARDTLKMSDMGAKIMGGMTKEEAREILRKYGRWY